MNNTLSLKSIGAHETGFVFDLYT